MKGEVSIAVIVPLLNEARALAEALPGLQTLPVDELLFVDGGSTDESRQLLAGAGVRWLAAGRGRAIQMNAGARVCKSELLLFLHIDTWIDAEHIRALRQALAGPDMAGGRFDLRLAGGHPAFP